MHAQMAQHTVHAERSPLCPNATVLHTIQVLRDHLHAQMALYTQYKC